MRPFLATLACLLFSCAHEPAGTLIAPYTEGSTLPGGYRIETIEHDEAGAIAVRLAGDPAAEVLFFGRDDGAPAFTRTTHCDVIYDSDLPQGSRTPAGLARAVEALAGAAGDSDDLCSRLPTSTSRRSDPAQPWQPFAACALALLVFTFLGLATSRARPAWREATFWIVVGLATVAGGLLRFSDISAPFAYSAYTQRIEMAEASLLHILTMAVHDPRHPPMTTLVLHSVLWLGRDEWLLRLPFVAASTISLPLIALLGRRLAGRLCGGAACLTCALLPPLVELGTHVGSHPLLLALAPALLLALGRMIDRPRWGTCLALAAATGASLWTSYLSIFLVAPQLVLVIRPATRRWAGRALAIGAGIGVLPLFWMVRGFLGDMSLRKVSERVPDAVWGDSSVWQILAEGTGMIGITLASVLAVLAILGAVLLIRRDGPGFGLVFASCAWLPPLVILGITPITRMRELYVLDLLPLLVVLGTAGASLAGRWLARRVPEPRRWIPAGLAWGPAFLLAALAAWPAYTGGPQSLRPPRQSPCYRDAAHAISGSEVRTAVVPYGRCRTLLGYYLGGGGSQPGHRDALASWTTLGGFFLGWYDEPTRSLAGPTIWIYADVTIMNLMRVRSLGPDWRQEAEKSLELITRSQVVWLVDEIDLEQTWPSLEKAGSCSVHSRCGRLRLLLCGRAGADGTDGP
jgi:hypothetical protein